jgi:hypothetical protein
MFNTSSYRPALTRLAADQRGVIAIISAIAVTALLGFAGQMRGEAEAGASIEVTREAARRNRL